MSVATQTRPLAAVLRDDGKIELRGPYNAMMLEWYHSLPAARWDKVRNCWTCAATPAACWRITSRCPTVVDADDEIRQRGHAFIRPTLEPQPPRQPAIQRGEAWGHQAAAYTFAFDREATLLDMWMGTGKSRVVVNLSDNWGCRKVLILCPVSVRGVWAREFAKHSPAPWHVVIPRGATLAKKIASAILDATLAEATGRSLAIVVNYETAKLEAFARFALGVEWDLVVCDESHRIKGAGSQISKFCEKLGAVAKRRLALSGTPMAHSPLDLFGQYRFLDRGIFGTSYHRFRSQFAISGPFGADHVVGFKNQDELARAAALIMFSVGPEVLDLPEAQHIDIPIALGTKARKVYDELEEEMIAYVDGGGEITTPNALVKLLRLQQITGGFCVNDAEELIELGTEKRDALRDLLDGVSEPIVVCCRFRHDLAYVRALAEELGRRYGELSGADKGGLAADATMAEGIDVLGVQIQSGGVGVDLTRARLCVLYSVGYSLGEYEQFLCRVHRPGQTRPVVYYHLVAEDTVDRVVYRALEKKREIIDEVFSYMKVEET